MVDAILHNISSTMENAEIFISQVLEFLLLVDPGMYEDVSGPLDLSVMLSSDCKQDIIKIRTLSTCEFSVNELLLPKSLLENLEGEATISSNVKTSRG
jgi:hypothetical protein